MQLIVASLVAGLVALTAAQGLPDLNGLPSCARGCVGSSVNVPGCRGLDIRCICSNRDFLNNISCCIARSCSPEEQSSTIRFASGLCATAGVTVPNEATCPSGSGSSSASASSTTTGLSALSSSAGSALASATASAGDALASVTSSAGSRASSLLSAASSLVGSATSSLDSALASATSAAGSAATGATQSTNVANGMVQMGNGLGAAGALAAIFALI